MKPCEVVGCPLEAKRERLCTPHCFVWLISKGSDKTPGREERRRAFVNRASARNFSGPGATIREEG